MASGRFRGPSTTARETPEGRLHANNLLNYIRSATKHQNNRFRTDPEHLKKCRKIEFLAENGSRKFSKLTGALCVAGGLEGAGKAGFSMDRPVREGKKILRHKSRGIPLIFDALSIPHSGYTPINGANGTFDFVQVLPLTLYSKDIRELFWRAAHL